MPRKGRTAEQIIGLLRQAEVEICRGLGVSEASFYRWRAAHAPRSTHTAWSPSPAPRRNTEPHESPINHPGIPDCRSGLAAPPQTTSVETDGQEDRPTYRSRGQAGGARHSYGPRRPHACGPPKRTSALIMRACHLCAQVGRRRARLLSCNRTKQARSCRPKNDGSRNGRCRLSTMERNRRVREQPDRPLELAPWLRSPHLSRYRRNTAGPD